MRLDSAVFYSNDIEAATLFYRDFVGLELDYRQGDQYVSFRFSNGVRLGIKRAVEQREVPGAQTVFVDVPDVQATYIKMQKCGANIIKDLVDTPGFGKNFSVLDPDKNKVQFVQRSGGQ